MKDAMTGRPPDKISDDYLCPRCEDRSLRKGGFITMINRNGSKRVQRYNCTHCHYHTTRPLPIEGASDEKTA